MISNWRPFPTIQSELACNPQKNLIADLAALRLFIRSALVAPEYEASAKWERLIVLTDVGRSALQHAGTANEQTAATLHMAAFIAFCHHDLYIDCEKSDISGLRSLVHEELLSKALHLPFRFGRVLYDKFSITYSGSRTDHLPSDEARALIEQTPQGLFQLGCLVSGPFGLLDAPHTRYIPPSRAALLWHCSDPGCLSPHEVELLNHDTAVHRTAKAIRRIERERLGPPSEWNAALSDLLGRGIPTQPYDYIDIGVTIADCVTGVERTALLEAALTGPSGAHLRDVLGSPPRRKSASVGSADVVARSLSSEEQLQLLFLLNDSELVSLVDRCIDKCVIRVPSSERRQPQNVPEKLSGATTTEISCLGVRTSGQDPLVDTGALIWDAYLSSNRVSELDWRLQNRTGAATRNMLMDYLCKAEPVQMLKDLVLGSEPITRMLCEKLQCPMHDVGEKLVEQMLWKLGFNVARFSENLGLLRRRLDSFSRELLAVGVIRDESDRERIRGVGVNLFVSVEDFIEQLVAYNIWLLSSDHFLETHFTFDIRSARRRVSAVLGECIGSGPTESRWNSESLNTLGPLMVYMNAATAWMKSLFSTEREPLLRPEEDLPHYSVDRFRVFPFLHTALWADSSYGSLEQYADGFSAITLKLARSNLAHIRNGLDHKRDDHAFPKIDEMIAFAAHFKEALESADDGRYVPKEFWIDTAQSDRFRRSSHTFKDYRGRTYTLYRPTFIREVSGYGTKGPVLVAPGNILGHANADIILGLRQKSVYTEYWDGYPKRRQIPNPHRRPSVASSQDEPPLEGSGSSIPLVES